ncbi:MAG: hypothetical protein ABJA82_10645 [Myxococcales bacterium]
MRGEVRGWATRERLRQVVRLLAVEVQRRVVRPARVQGGLVPEGGEPGGRAPGVPSRAEVPVLAVPRQAAVEVPAAGRVPAVRRPAELAAAAPEPVPVLVYARER